MRIGLWVRVWGQNSARKLVSTILLNTEQLITQQFDLHEVALVTFAHMLQFCIYQDFLCTSHICVYSRRTSKAKHLAEMLMMAKYEIHLHENILKIPLMGGDITCIQLGNF